jgi:hypothetical protein
MSLHRADHNTDPTAAARCGLVRNMAVAMAADIAERVGGRQKVWVRRSTLRMLLLGPQGVGRTGVMASLCRMMPTRHNAICTSNATHLVALRPPRALSMICRGSAGVSCPVR